MTEVPELKPCQLIIDIPRALRDNDYLNEISEELKGYSAYDLRLDAADEIERLRAAPQVKKLEWKPKPIGNDIWCDSPVGTYSIGDIYGLWMWFLLTSKEDLKYTAKGCADELGENSEDSAKAAAQADYERRILSALVGEGVE